METNSIDNKCKEALSKRSIPPSEEAWNKLDAALGEAVAPKRKSYLWYGIAAGFTGIVLISVLYFSYQEPGIVKPSEVVKAPVEEKLPNTVPGLLDVPKEADLAGTAKAQPVEEESSTPLRGTEKKTVKVQLSSDKVAANVGIEKHPTEIRQEGLQESPAPSKEAKIAEVVAQVNAMEQLNGEVSDAEIDSMLRAAQQDIEGIPLAGNATSVDALALLSDVEDELNRSLRDQLFEKLKEGYLKVRTAVAYRND